MPTQRALTRTERYFLELYRSATISGAVQRAVREARYGLEYGLPVDVAALAESKRIIIREDVIELGCAHGKLVPVRDGFLVTLKEGLSDTWKRFALAHELGHTLFYRSDGGVVRHEVGLLDVNEIAAEERICSAFARALLMPAARVRDEIARIPPGAPAIALELLHRVAMLTFKVSVPLLLTRLAELRLGSQTYLALCFRFRENPVSQEEPDLRVSVRSILGEPRRFWIWRNRSAEHLNLRSVNTLFDSWRTIAPDQRDAESSRYFWQPEVGLVKWPAGSPVEVDEEVGVSVSWSGRWPKRTIPMAVASCLYAPPRATDRDAYVVSVMSPKVSSSAGQGCKEAMS